MPVYFEEDDLEYNIENVETFLEESVENAINKHYLETGDTSSIKYELEFEENNPPHIIQGNLNIHHQDLEMNIDFKLSKMVTTSFKLDYFPSTEEEIESEDTTVIFNYLADSIDSMIGLKGDGPSNNFKNNLSPRWTE